ncbi:MAG: hypothetical protein ACOCYZ_03820 [Halococcoides sp.]
MTRHPTTVEDGTIYVGEGEDRLPVGDLDRVIEAVGGFSWTIRYTDAERERHPGMATDDAGLTVDVVDVMLAMTHSDRFRETLAAHPVELPESAPTSSIAPRTGLFVGKLLENLENGMR